MGDRTYYFTTKFSGGGRTFISHFDLGPGATPAMIIAAATALEELTVAAPGDTVAQSGGHVVSVTETLQRLLATEDVKEVQDLATQNARLLTGRLVRLDSLVTPPKSYTLPWILKGVNPLATVPPLFDASPGSDYVTWVKEFLTKYSRVDDIAPTSVIVSRDTLMH